MLYQYKEFHLLSLAFCIHLDDLELEELAENIFDVIFKFRLVKKVKIKIEKLEIIKETESVGINVSKTRV